VKKRWGPSLYHAEIREFIEKGKGKNLSYFITKLEQQKKET